MYNPNSIWTSKNESHVTPTPAMESQKISVPIGHEVKPPTNKDFRWIWWVAMGCGVAVIAAGAWYYFFMMPPVAPDVAISFTPPSQIFVGDPFAVSISIKNSSTDVLRHGAVTLSLPNGMSLVGQPSDGKSFTYSLPDIDGGNSATVTSTLIATQNPQSVSHLSAQAIYTVASGSKQFATDGAIDLAVGPLAVGLTITAPPSAVGGSNARIVMTYTKNTSDTLPPMTLTLRHPPAFTFQTSSVAVSDGDIAWPLGPLASGANGTITVDGGIGTAASGTIYTFGGTFTEVVSGQTYVINGPTANIAVVPAPLFVSVAVNNSSSYISAAGDWLSYVLAYTNNANTSFTGVTITAKLTGVMFDLSTLQTTGFFNSTNDTVTWSPSAVPALATLTPGESGTVTFRVRTLKQISAHSASDKNYFLRVDGTISSPTILPGVTATSTTFGGGLATKVGGTIAVATNGYRYDAISGIANAGPYPSVVNQETSYTIHWVLTSALTDMKNVIVSASLPTGISFTGETASNVSSTPQYSPATGLITWQIPFVPANAGAVAAATQAVFQVSDTPGVNQVGQVVNLLGETSVQATDAFTGNAAAASADAVTTDLPKDTAARTAAHGSGAVRAQ